MFAMTCKKTCQKSILHVICELLFAVHDYCAMFVLQLHVDFRDTLDSDNLNHFTASFSKKYYIETLHLSFHAFPEKKLFFDFSTGCK